MTLIFLGLLYTDETIKNREKYSKKGLQMAPHVFQSNLLQGFDRNNIKVEVLSVPPIGSFPINCKKLFFKKEKWGKNRLQISFINLPKIKWYIQEKKLVKEINKIINKNKNDEIRIVAYSPYLPFLNTIKKIKKKYPFIKNNLIVTDPIPGRGDMEKYMTKSAVKKGCKIVALSKYVDTFTLLSKYLAETLEIQDKPFIVTECICNENQKLATIKEKNENIFLYTGSISSEFGVDTLVDVFSKIKNAELWICGKANSAESLNHVKEMAETYKNIKFLGFVSREEVSNLTDKCDYLINPRTPSGTYTKYSFPSKTADYMASGKPTIMYKLEAVPDSYDEYLNYITSTDIGTLKIEIENILNKDYRTLKEKAMQAREFIIKNNNSQKQASKIIEVLEK